MSETEYRIVYQIQRCTEESGDFVEVGFGSSSSWETVAAALYDVESQVDNQLWETGKGQPGPKELER